MCEAWTRKSDWLSPKRGESHLKNEAEWKIKVIEKFGSGFGPNLKNWQVLKIDSHRTYR